MSTTYETTTRLTTINCGCCGGTYAIGERYRAEKRAKGGTWNCPYCQVSWGYVTSTVDVLRRQLEEKQRQIERANSHANYYQHQSQQQARRAAAARGQVTKIKNRVARGECPCCKSTFADLAAHMQESHPDYAAAVAEEG